MFEVAINGARCGAREGYFAKCTQVVPPNGAFPYWGIWYKLGQYDVPRSLFIHIDKITEIEIIGGDEDDTRGDQVPDLLRGDSSDRDSGQLSSMQGVHPGEVGEASWPWDSHGDR